MEQWRQSVITLGGPLQATSLPLQSSFLPVPLEDSPGGLGRARSPTAKHVHAIDTVKQHYKIHSDVKCAICTVISMHAEFSHCRQN